MPEDPLPLPKFVAWPTFPFEGDLRVKRLEDPVSVEPPRDGEDPSECRACGASDEAYIWVSDRWRVRSLDRPTGLPAVLILESRSHFDLGDLPNMLAAELGVMTVRLERAIRSLDGVARVHVNRWGDGSAHLQLWFLARPYGRLQLRGEFLALWDEILPPISEQQWRENLALVAAWLADFGGRPLAEPPHLDWKAPATLASIPSIPASFVAGGGAPDDPHDGAGSDPGDRAAAAAGSPPGELAGSGTHDVSVTGARDGQTGDATASGSRLAGGVTDRGGAAHPAVVSEAAGAGPATAEAAPARAEAAPAPAGANPVTTGTASMTAGVPAVRTLPDEFTTVREIRVAPGPEGFAPITQPPLRSAVPAASGIPVQGGGKTDDPIRPVPGQREGGAQERDRPTAPLA